MRLLRKFPRLESCAYLIVFLVAIKLVMEWCGVDFQRADRMPFWAFWIALVGFLALAIVPDRSIPRNLPE